MAPEQIKSMEVDVRVDIYAGRNPVAVLTSYLR
jgi:hypothetical protein